jgi:pimeloyl-ACP methyl ester carboxylesterase
MSILPNHGWRRWLVRIAAALGIVLFAILLFAGGALTGALKLRHLVQEFNADTDRIVSPDGIDAAQYIELGGVRQWITIRGQNRGNPILLFLHGGPGGALADIAYQFARPWEDYFVVVQWDQRGYGRSNIDSAKIEGTTTKERYIADGIELADYLRKRLNQPKVVLIGQSWGTLLGAEIAHRRPDLLYAFVAFGQITGWESSYEQIRQLLLDLGRRTGDTPLVKRMQDAGPIPVGPKPGPFFAAMDSVWDEMNRRGYSWHSVIGSPSPLDELFLAATIESPTVSDRRMMGLMLGGNGNDYYTTLHPTLSGWNLERDVGTRFAVPYILVMGRYDWQTPVNLAKAFYAKVCAPYKAYVDLPNAAHAAVLEQPGLSVVALVEKVLPAVSGAVPAGAETCAAAPEDGAGKQS